MNLFLRCLTLCFIFNITITLGYNQYGPDPWHYDIQKPLESKRLDIPVPPDLKLTVGSKRNGERINNVGDWFYKRMLALVLKGGQVKEIGDVEVYVQMKFSKDRWKLLNEYIMSTNGLTEEMYRRSIGYIEDSIYKPTIVDKITVAWSEYIQLYLSIYKQEIVHSLGLLAVLVAICVMWNRLSTKQFRMLLFMAVYVYEAIVSYKEAEQQEYQQFVKVLNQCNWYFWSSSCELPAPDILIFLKHMHPLKILARIFTILISEPLVGISSAITVLVHGFTDGLWFPMDKIAAGILTIFFNLILVIILIMIVFNLVLNMPFNLSFFAGLISFGVKQRTSSVADELLTVNSSSNGRDDRLSGKNLHTLLNILADNHKRSKEPVHTLSSVGKQPCIRRSASAGRLTDLTKSSNHEQNLLIDKKPTMRKRFALFKMGGGDGNT